MIILGIDPGSRRIGYGVIKHGATPVYIDAGLVSITATEDAPALVELRAQLRELIAQHSPDIIGVEKLFFTNNRTTGIAVGQARGVILECVAASGIPCVELTPNEIKQGVTGSGRAPKQAVAKMVRFILGKQSLNLIDDAMDALAIALVTGQRSRMRN
jgi:crossover junction endodeoxyribonuclease RuvC